MAPAGLALLLLALCAAGCSRKGAPVASTWAEQLSAADRAVQAKGGDYVFVGADVIWDSAHGEFVDEPLELLVNMRYVGPPSPTETDSEGKPRRMTRTVYFRDLHLASTLGVLDDAIGEKALGYVVPGDKELARSVKLSPQDVMKLTVKDAEANNGGKPITKNVSLKLHLGPNVPERFNVPAVWFIEYTHDKFLYIWVDAQSGAVLEKRLH